MTEWVKIPDYQPPIATECMVCGKEINLGYCTNHLVPMICEECKEAIKYAKKLIEMAAEVRRKDFSLEKLIIRKKKLDLDDRMSSRMVKCAALLNAAGD